MLKTNAEIGADVLRQVNAKGRARRDHNAAVRNLAAAVEREALTAEILRQHGMDPATQLLSKINGLSDLLKKGTK